ncbi:uncharacterized protein [Diadema antillarum]|uniref:uncharacterized protein n=1 Tax=Diadema antillarum TaxID=105358 RepID=UPI003A8A07B6
MVLFININVGQRVEVIYKGEVHEGTVKYKGGLTNVTGDWVGIELDEPVGKHNGLYKGRQYFSCRNKHGIFVHPSRIRFMFTKRMYFDTYKSVSPDSSFDETLFHTAKPKVLGYSDGKSVNGSYLDTARQGFEEQTDTWFAGKSAKLHTRSYSETATPNYHLGHPVGSRFRVKTEAEKDEEDKTLRIRPKSALGSCTPHLTARSLNYSMLGHTRPLSGRLSASFDKTTGRASVLSASFGGEEDIPFISTPSIPKTYMPHAPLQRQNMIGWSQTHRPREWTL